MPARLDEPSTAQAAIDMVLYEAALLDESRFAEWLELFTDDAEYWAPASHDAVAPYLVVNHIFDDRRRLDDRVYRLTEKYAHAESPPTRTCRMFSGLRPSQTEVLWPGAPGGDFVTEATFCIASLRAGRQQTLFGRVSHALRATDSGLRIASKKVVLLTCEEPTQNLSFPL